ncbi:MAG TPA: hypothetical protein VFN35_03140 [Ktedonobacteraceae bacterium]|nr:hypothetical protein [Ktedonobacteraceae bacterium]
MNMMDRFDFPFENLMRNFTPMTSWKRFFNPQFYFTCNSEDEDIENHVLAKVGSYGKQLGQIIDVLDALVDVLEASTPINNLSCEQQKAIKEFRQLSKNVDKAIADAN